MRHPSLLSVSIAIVETNSSPLWCSRDGYDAKLIREVDLTPAGVQSIIWATGFTFDFSLVRLPVSDSDGYRIQTRGITKYPGLYFVGLPWIHNAKSGLLFGVGEDAEFIAATIEARNR